jgi:5-methylcytosine-specific restriction endonuclease McrA
MTGKSKQQDGFKRCAHCQEVKPLEGFSRNTLSKDGRNSWCKPCDSAATRAWQKANPERTYERVSKWKRDNPDMVLAQRHNERAVSAGAEGRVTGDELASKRVAQEGCCAYCNRRGFKLHVDHITPLSLGGRGDIGNICFVCARCNSSKNNRTPDQWTNRWYLRPADEQTRKPNTSARKARKDAAPMLQKGRRWSRLMSPFRGRF